MNYEYCWKDVQATDKENLTRAIQAFINKGWEVVLISQFDLSNYHLVYFRRPIEE